MKTSQKQNILRHLLYGPLCGQERDWELGNRIPARIHELRGKGFPIKKRTCDQGHVHLTHQWEFYIDAVVSPLLYQDWCAHCGASGSLRHFDNHPKRHSTRVIAGRTLEPVACSECGKGDWR